MEELLKDIAALKTEINQADLSTADNLEAFRMRFLIRNGAIQALFGRFKDVPNENKKAVGAELNILKDLAESRFAEAKEALENSIVATAAPIDVTLPHIPNLQGSRHPITLVKDRVVEIFSQLGFGLADGPEVEDDWHNFSALHFGPDHPARDMQDTFFVDTKDSQGQPMLLRTHTSTVQIRVLENRKPPLRLLMPGKVYRNEAISARAHCLFHQVEGLYIDEKVSFAELKQTLYHFVTEMFGNEVKVRFRPSYFPFTEPSAEMDISCLICKGDGCNMCKHTGWVEILGCGMVDPDVLKNMGIDPEKYTGYAFGMGLERMANLLFRIPDLRLFTENDVRFLRQFKGLIMS